MFSADSAIASDAATDSSSAPRVAVIVPAYGVAHLLDDALRSVLAQTFTAWECLIVDDGAPDDVAAAVAPYLADPRFRFLQTDNRGVAEARNRAIAAARAPLATLLDGDDLLRPGYLSAVVPLLEQDSEVVLITANSRIFGAVQHERDCFDGPQPAGTLANVLDRSFGVHICSTFRKSDWARAGGFDPAFRHCEDFDMWIRLVQLGGRAHYVDAVLSEYRVRSGSASADTTRMMLGDLQAYEKARAALPADAPEQSLLTGLIAQMRDNLALEHAIDRVIDGDIVNGIADLAAFRRRLGGAVWQASFLLWQVLPKLARPMLRWRRLRHSRGYQGLVLRDLLTGTSS